MCGIAGQINFNGNPVKESDLELMHKALSRRGPDNSEVYKDQNVGLSHSRLSIIDLSASARQPMCNDESAWIA